MRKRLFVYIIVFAMTSIFFLHCSGDKQAPVGPTEEDPWEPFYHPELVEDTTRIWMTPQGDTLSIYPKALYARFYPWVTDTNQILALLEKHHLHLPARPTWRPSQYGETTYYDMWLCVPDNRRAEYHFTPYGRDDLDNFGADSLVEYCFAMFSEGMSAPNGRIILEFSENTPQARIDSLFDANGLRFMHVQPAAYRDHYTAFITRSAKRNVLDLACYLKRLPFVRECWVDFLIPLSAIRCE